MSLNPGTRLGVYDITARIGEGGMGQVYRATDTTLGREVAIKILPNAFAADPDRLARFEREAKTLAALNHPHIAAIYGFEKSDGLQALVMELVEGEDVSQRLEKGAIPIDDALPIAKQIADALEAAHAQGIIHRDLKPANIKVRADGTVKVLDFGLAKTMESAAVSSSGLSMSPTLTTPAMMTGVGMILGTAAYMSPEQAKGRAVDKRSDIWAFGAVLFEMLSGQRAFQGEDITDTIAAIMRGEPAWGALPPDTPANVRWLLESCLAKDRQQRASDIAVVQFLLDNRPPVPPVASTSSAVSRTPRLPWAIASILLLSLLAGATAVSLRRPVPDAHTYRSTIQLQVSLAGFAAGRLALSPDGRRLAFVAQGVNQRPQLWVRSLDGITAQPLAGTDGAASPFWSPDGRFLAFTVGGKLKRIDAAGGAAMTLSDNAFGYPGTWNSDDVILFTPTPDSPLFRVSAAGGTPSPATTLDATTGESRHYSPVFLPDGRHFLFLALAGGTTEPHGIYVGSLDSPQRTRVVDKGSNVKYADGYLFYLRDTTLLAQRFDLKRFVTTADPTPVAEDVLINPNRTGAFDVSEAGALIYQYGSGEASQLTWFDRSGRQIGVIGDRAVRSGFDLAPDETFVAEALLDPDRRTTDIWLHEISRGLRSRFTFDPADDSWPVWAPDGRQIVFGSRRKTHLDLWARLLNRTGVDEVLLADDSDKRANTWSADGRFIIYSVTGAGTGNDLWLLSMSGDRKPTPFLATPFNEAAPTFSPDGRWVAYQSNEGGRNEVYVTRFLKPERNGRCQRRVAPNRDGARTATRSSTYRTTS